jgi:hypothetical protein
MTTPAGWYPDPSGAGGQRYFDGASWTDHQGVAPVRKRRVWPWIVTVVLLLLLGGCGTFLVSERSSISSVISAARMATAGDPVDDGSLRFVVTSVGKANIQSDPQPAGVYFIADVNVTNMGKEPRSFDVQNQKLINAAGRKYAAMSADVVAAKLETKTVVVKPGEVIEVAMRFDVPRQPKVTEIELHESPTSAGAKVRL